MKKIFEKIKIIYKNTMEEVQLNIKYNHLSIQRRSVLSEIGMLYIKKGKNTGLTDREIDELVKKTIVLSKQIKETAEQLKIQEEVDFSLVRTGENKMKDRINEFMLRISTSSEKYNLRRKYDALVDQGVDTLSQIGFFVITSKNKNFEEIPEYRILKKKYETVHQEYLEMGREIKAIQVLARERSQFLIPILTFAFSMKDWAKEEHSKKLKN